MEYQLISTSEDNGVTTKTYALEVPGVGCIIRVLSTNGEDIAESLTFAEKVRIQDGKLVR